MMKQKILATATRWGVRRLGMTAPGVGWPNRARLYIGILLVVFISVAAVNASVGSDSATGRQENGRLENPIPETIPEGSIRIKLKPVATGLTAPNWGVSAPGLNGYLFVSDQTGKLWKINLATGEKNVFFDLGPRLVNLGVSGENTPDERGFLGFAFHPDYASNGLLYTYTSEPVNGDADFSTMPEGSEPDHQSVIVEWKVNDPSDPESVVDPNTGRELMRIDQPQYNHNGGGLNFGPDNMLYISLGDGGGADDLDGRPFRGEPMVGHGETGNGQNPANVLGTILRIDPQGSNSENEQYGIPEDNPFVDEEEGFQREVYAYGFRNPFRFSFDSETDELYVGDVGQNDIEEIDNVTAGGNYGWNLKEGSFFFNPNGDEPGFVTNVDPGVPEDLIDPIAEYDHDEGNAVIGGFVYRGSRIPELEGKYVFGDFSQNSDNGGRLFYLDDNATIKEFGILNEDELGLSVLGFGQDADGELYVLANETGTPFGTTGVVLKIASACEIGGTGEGMIVSGIIDAQQCDTFTLLLSRRPPEPTNGRLYICLSVPSQPDLADYHFFRPGDEQVPLPNGAYVQLVRTPAGFIAGAEDFYYSEGELNGDDLEFSIGTDGLQGEQLIIETYFLEEGVEFSEETLTRIQRVTVDMSPAE